MLIAPPSGGFGGASRSARSSSRSLVAAQRRARVRSAPPGDTDAKGLPLSPRCHRPLCHAAVSAASLDASGSDGREETEAFVAKVQSELSPVEEVSDTQLPLSDSSLLRGVSALRKLPDVKLDEWKRAESVRHDSAATK